MDVSASLSELRKNINAIHPLSEAEWYEFAGIWQHFQAKRKVILTASGDTERYLYFVTEGVQRAFALHHDKEATLVFMYPYSFGGVADSFLLQTPSRYYFETLTQSRFLRTTHAQVQQLMQKHHNFETLIRVYLSHILAGVLERLIESQVYSVEEKFRTLLTRSPHILRLIPHKYLASYLGLDPISHIFFNRIAEANETYRGL